MSRIAAFATLVGGLTFPPGALALESAWADVGEAKVRLLAAGPTSVGAPLRAGIEIRMTPGWHTYWRYPGDAGVPPRFDWSGSDNVAAVNVRWPAPERIVVEGLQSIGYYDYVLFPLQIVAVDPRRPTTLRLRMDFGVCETICIPATTELELDIPAGLSGKSSSLDAAESRVPAKAELGERRNVAVLAAELERGKEPRVLVDVAIPPGSKFDLFAEGPTDAWALPLPERIEAADGRARFTVPIDGAPPGEDPIPPKLHLTLVAGGEAVEVDASLD